MWRLIFKQLVDFSTVIKIPIRYPLVNPLGIIYVGFMKKDLHTKRQKQIRMTDELRARFDKAIKDSGLPTDQYLEHLLNLADGKNQPSNTELLAIIRERLK